MKNKINKEMKGEELLNFFHNRVYEHIDSNYLLNIQESQQQSGEQYAIIIKHVENSEKVTLKTIVDIFENPIVNMTEMPFMIGFFIENEYMTYFVFRKDLELFGIEV